MAEFGDISRGNTSQGTALLSDLAEDRNDQATESIGLEPEDVGSFTEKLQEYSMIGSVFLIVWIFRYVIRSSEYEVKAAEIQARKLNHDAPDNVLRAPNRQTSMIIAARRKSVIFAFIMLVVGLVVQFSACAALSYSVWKSLNQYTGGADSPANGYNMTRENVHLLKESPVPEYILKAYVQPYSLCPGTDNIDDFFFDDEDKNFEIIIDEEFMNANSLVATSSQIWFFVSALIIIWMLTCFDWWNTVLAVKWLCRKETKVDPGETMQSLISRNRKTMFFDLTFHVTLLCLLYSTSIIALFYIGSVGKMVSTMFAMVFLEKIDDIIKESTLSQTNLAEVMHEMYTAQQSEKQAMPRKIFPMYFSFLLHVMYLAVVGSGIWTLVMLGSGCKPGTNNGFAFF